VGTALSLWLKRPACGVEHPPLSSVQVKEVWSYKHSAHLDPRVIFYGKLLPLPFKCNEVVHENGAVQDGVKLLNTKF
jgi:hypothetical protein